MRQKTVYLYFLPVLLILMMFSSKVFAMGILPKLPIKKPPVINNPPPPSAPEPLTLTLIGMGVSGAAGYFLGRGKKK
jgi:hypothetical protein